MLPWQPSFDSYVFQNLVFSFQEGYIFLFLLFRLYWITIKLAIFYQINYHCLCDLGYLVTDLRKILEYTITKWQMLGSVFNSMNFSRNFTIGGFFCSKPSFYTSRNGQNLVNSEWRLQDGGWFQFTLRGKINGIWSLPINSTKWRNNDIILRHRVNQVIPRWKK